MIYDNPHALVLCHYKRDGALCHRDGARDTPSLDRCVPGCGNIAQTDQQSAQLRERARPGRPGRARPLSPSATGSAPLRMAKSDLQGPPRYLGRL